ncbi:Fanconi anemia group C protein homolog [Montipora capricornis]|uniref:Fanconi anemia group C protein homolog n=1 Tax=Montipora capricornis TaxID=246305 RepID=UPI0035F12D6E
MSVSETDVKRWFDIVQKWSSENSADKCRDTFKRFDELSSFLKELERAIAEAADNPQQVLQKYPSVGKLLGELYKNTVLLLTEDAFQTVVRCSFALACYCGAQGRKTKKAKDWVLMQLRCVTTPTLPNSNLLEIGEYWGYTAQESMEVMVDELVSSLCRDLEVLKSFTWNAEEREYYPYKPVSGLCLRELSEFCLPLVPLPQAKPLVEKILCCQKGLDLISSVQGNVFCVSDNVSVLFLKTVASRKDLQLSYNARIALWKRYQPSLESEILDLIEMSAVRRPFMSTAQLQHAISSRDLPRACVENPELFTLSMSILSLFFVRTRGNPQVAKLLSAFSEMCVEESKQGNQNAPSTFSRMLPSFC